MIQHLHLRDAKQEGALFNRRMEFLFAIIMVVVFLLLLRLAYLQLALYSHYSTLARDNRVKVLPIAPARGLIYSNDGELLAENLVSYDLHIIPERAEDLQTTIANLQEWITIQDQDVEHFHVVTRGKRRFKSTVLRSDLSERERAIISVNLHHVPGAEIVARLGRHYPQNEAFAHVLGYVGRIDKDDLKTLDRKIYKGTTHIGKLGVERAWEKTLHGRPGHQQVEVNTYGRIVRTLARTAPVSGQDLHLGLDAALQRAAMLELSNRRGAIVAIEPDSGNVLAAVSSPSYDPNHFVSGISSVIYRSLLRSSDRPLFNRFLAGEYAPGSTLKPFWGLIALESGVRTTEDTLHCRGQMILNRHIFHDWKRHGHGVTNLRRAISESCDVYFYQLALDLGIERMGKGLSRFGFGATSGLDIPGERKGLVPSREWKYRMHNTAWYPGESILLGIGQGYILTTPLQLARATVSLANGGVLVQPRLVVPTDTTHDTHTVVPYGHRVEGIEQRHLKHIISSMREVVHGARGTARRSGLGAHYEFAGKTGTSQVVRLPADRVAAKEQPNETLRDHALFIAFAPFEEPRIALAVVVENGGSGGAIAAPIARRLFDHYLSRL